MSLVVQKFGGTSVANIERLRAVAGIIKRARDKGKRVTAVVSAMAGVTNQLASYVHAAGSMLKTPEALQESDVILSSGEQVTSGLLSLCLQELGIPSRSFMGWQIPIYTNSKHTDAAVTAIDPSPLHHFMEEGGIPVVTGFQGIHDARMTTLGRGGSDMTAVALAHALQADFCDIYTDVSGVYTADPRLISDAEKIDKITFEEMQLLADHGAKVLQPKCVAYAFEKKVRLRILSSFHTAEEGTEIIETSPYATAANDLSGIAHSFNDARLSLRSLSLQSYTVLRKMSQILTQQGLLFDGLSKAIHPGEKDAAHIDFFVTKADLVPTLTFLRKKQSDIGFSDIDVDQNVVKIALIGHGFKENTDLSTKVLRVITHELQALGLSAAITGLSEMKMTLVAQEKEARPVIQALHDYFIKRKKEKKAQC